MRQPKAIMAAADVEEEVDIALIEYSTSTVPSLGGIAHANGLNCTLIGNPYCSNMTIDQEDIQDELEAERIISIVVPTIFGIIVLLGLLGNLLVIIVVMADKHMRNTTNILILSLAVADLLFIVFCVPFTAVQYARSVWPFGSVWCKMVQYLIFVTAYLSVYTLVLMSLDRYLAVVHAIRSMSIRNEFNTWLAVAVTWTVIFVVHTPLLVQYDVLHYTHFGQNRSTCINVEHALHDANAGKIFQVCFLAFGYVIPLGVVCVMYGLMLKRLLYGVVPGGNQSQESIRAKKRVTRMVIVVVIIFAVCWLPIQVILVLQKFEAYSATPSLIAVQIASNVFAYTNSCVNPFLYAFLSDNFRRSFQKFLCCSQPTSARRMEYERTNIRYSEKETKSTNVSRTLKNDV